MNRISNKREWRELKEHLLNNYVVIRSELFESEDGSEYETQCDAKLKQITAILTMMDDKDGTHEFYNLYHDLNDWEGTK